MMLKDNVICSFGVYFLVTSVVFGLASAKSSVWMEPKDINLEVFKNTSITAFYSNLTSEWPVNVTVEGRHVVRVQQTSYNLPTGSGKVIIDIITVKAGHADIVMKPSNGSTDMFHDAFVHVTVPKHSYLNTISWVIGWIYFFAWSISYYPQTYENWRRKSVVGLHFDFLSLNTIAFTCYSAYNVGLYCVPLVQKEYFSLHPRGVIPIELNDVFFPLHALFACLTQVAQCFIYERGGQKVSRIAKLVTLGVLLWGFVGGILADTNVITWLSYLYVLSYIKLGITFIKYIPQAYYNYVRKSTQGWSIGNVLLDFIGGICSIVQMFIISYNFNDWESIFGNPAKFGLGVFSCCFDVLFILQHYVFYKANPYQEIHTAQSEDEEESHNIKQRDD